ncbi:unconventional myosin-Va-like isoform X4 [Ruditapes philippinarum]|uniref:unconventional myosin-Va-like isoform X4 n=1 Tax=Ruditapes philippinarum TaxID=129788 RepID=UPI00295A9096|nr:unconventional myosin-Va-like isoform X4 [Ruditapes philippinarum]
MSAVELYTKGARVWLPDPDVVWRGAELLEDYKEAPCKLKVHYEEGEISLQDLHLHQKLAKETESVIDIKDKTKLPHLRNPDILIGENDLTSLSYLNEPEVLYNLKVRFEERNIIYTYCGIVLVAINPYEQLDIYNNDIIQAYSGQDMGAMDPHIYAVAEEAYKRMSRFEQNQSIIVSGESGAGKTVSAKYAMRYFAMVGGSQAETQVEKKVLASNPIMEAIGNAKTTRNDNSSRFGKYIEISFSKSNEIVGAHMRTYLLEKSRVVFQAKDERNYHVFYQLCASRELPELKKFGLMPAEKFYYTSQGKNPVIDGVDDEKEYRTTKEAMKMLGLSEKDINMIFQIFSAVLHFGNVKINEKDGESSEMAPKDPSVGIACKLFGVDESQMRTWICNKKITTVGETLTKPLTAAQASFAQDALSKCIYSKLFDWIVTQINKALVSQTKLHRFIGVLDIYGFETFQINSFEQFCINYANEKLQQIFNMHVFKLEQEEYVKEAIEWSFIDYYDNQPCIDLIEAKLGILDLLDEECKVPNGSDKNWCQKLYGKHLKHSHFQKPKIGMESFIILHFADKVTYTAKGFLDKNRDAVSEEHVNIMKASEYELVAELFADLESDADASKGRVQALQSGPKGTSKKMRKTVGSQFRESLFLLMTTLNSTSPHYIRCIKPNDLKAAFEFEPKRAVEQLRACGVLETIRISAAGFPSRWTYPEFFQRYRVLAISKDINRKDFRKSCQNVLPKLIQDPDKYRFGKTKIFFRAGQVAYLEKLRADKLRACGIMIQKHVRGWLMKNKYQKLRISVLGVQRYGRGLLARRYAQHLRETRAATTIQKHWRGYKTRKSFNRIQKAVVKLQSVIRGYFGRKDFKRRLYEHKTTIIQARVRAYLARRQYKRVIYGVVKIQGHFKRRKAKAELRQLKIEAKSMDHMKNVNKGLENKIIQLQQQLDSKKKVSTDVIHKQEETIKQLETEKEKLLITASEAAKASNKVTELEEELARLRKELEQERGEKQDLISEKQLLKNKYDKEVGQLQSENVKIKAELDESNRKLKEQSKIATVAAGGDQQKWEEQKLQFLSDMESERQHHQRLVKEHNRLLQRFENMQGEMQMLTSPTGHKRTPSDISMISLESVSPDDKKDDGEEGEKEDQGYGTEKKKRQAPVPPSASSMEKVMKEATAEKTDKEKLPKVPEAGIDVGLMLKLQNKVKSLEKERDQLRAKLEGLEEEMKQGTGAFSESAFTTLKDNAYFCLSMQELENENDKLKRECAKLMESIAKTTNFNKGGKTTAAGKEFLGHRMSLRRHKSEDPTKTVPDPSKIINDQFEAMTDELERRREECLQLRALLAEKSISTHSVAKQSYGGQDNIVNEDNELTMAYKSQRDIIRLLENQLQKAEGELKKKVGDYDAEVKELRKENDKQHKLIQQSLSMTPDAKIEATMQHEITRLTSENLDLREVIDKQADQIRKLKKMLKVYAKRMKDGEAAEIQAELEKEETKSVENVAQIKHRERNYMGMLEYKKEDEGPLIKVLILDLKPKVTSAFLPGLPAYLLFMCVRHTDYINDDEKVRSFLTSTINGIKKVVKKHHDDLERVTLWLANTCRFLHTLKQYSGEKQFQTENTPRQNEHCLRNFDLAEYRQVFSDLAVWIYQTLIKLMEATIQPSIVSAVLEHEAIAGLTGSKPSGLRGRSSSRAEDTPEHSLDTLMKSMNQFVRTLTQHAVDPELIKQIFRQLYYFLGASALNNLLLRKDMCNWSKGMQIRYNLSHLEQWLRDNKLQESGAGNTLEPIVQASQLLQARKTDADVDSVYEMCSKLTAPQIVKILNLYTPVDEFEERVPISFIRKIQQKLKERDHVETSLLMDLKFSYSVTFPFNPSKIALESIDIPEQLHLGNLVTRS